MPLGILGMIWEELERSADPAGWAAVEPELLCGCHCRTGKLWLSGEEFTGH